MKVDIDNKDVGLINSVIKKLPYQQTLKQFVSSSVQHYIDYLKKKRVIWKSLTSLVLQKWVHVSGVSGRTSWWGCPWCPLPGVRSTPWVHQGDGSWRVDWVGGTGCWGTGQSSLTVNIVGLDWILGDRRDGKINPTRSVWCSRLFEHSFEHPLQPQSPRDVCQPQTSTKSSGGLTLGLFEPCLNGRMVLLVKRFSVFSLNTRLNWWHHFFMTTNGFWRDLWNGTKEYQDCKVH